MEQRYRFAELLTQKLLGICDLSGDQIEALFGHYELLARWNRILNLTSIRSLEDAVVRHYCESVFLGAQLPRQALSVLDVGSGAGFPGIPIAVLRPDCRVVLAESHQRKAVFLREATRGWPNISVFAGRAQALEGRFDWVVSRAVRWEEALEIARRASRCLALLLGDQDSAEAVTKAGADWAEPIRLPWGKRRVLLMGTLRTGAGVSRGT